MMNTQDTICALATPNGVGAIAIIRVSGSNSFAQVTKCFSKSFVGKTSPCLCAANGSARLCLRGRDSL